MGEKIKNNKGKTILLIVGSFAFVAVASFAINQQDGTVSLADSILNSTEVERADNLQEFIKETETDIEDISFSVDKMTGDVENGDFEEVFGEEFNKSKAESIIENSDYQIIDETSTEYTVASPYATNRVLINREISSLNGAESGVAYNGSTVLMYSDEETTKEGYEQLVEKYGEENVIPDIPMKAEAFGWGTSFMGLDSWTNQIQSSGKATTVAVLDTGINQNHIIFSGKQISGKNIINASSSYADDNEHGTAVAGIIAESTPANTKLLIVKVMNSKGQTTMLTYLNGVDYAVSQGADVLNCSLGGELDSSAAATAVDKRLKPAVDAGCIIVCASGNETANMDKGIFYPAESPYTISVGAISTKGKRVSYSNYGSNLDFSAPGQSVLVANYRNANSFETVSGTSLACPYITAAADLLRSEKGALNYQQIKSELAGMCVDYGASGKDVYYGYGMPKYVAKKVMSGCTINLGYTTTVYNGTEKRPSVSVSGLTKDKDYTVSYKNNVNVGTATVTVTGKGNYTGSKSATFTITPKSLTPTIVLSQSLFYYDRTDKRPTVTVKDGNMVIPDSNYTVSYSSSSKAVGTYTVKVTLKNNYSGSASTTYRVAKHKRYVVITKNGRFYKIIEMAW